MSEIKDDFDINRIYQIIPKSYKQYQPVQIENTESSYLINFD